MRYDGLNQSASPVHQYVWLTREWARMIEVDCEGAILRGSWGICLKARTKRNNLKYIVLFNIHRFRLFARVLILSDYHIDRVSCQTTSLLDSNGTFGLR